MLLKKFSPGKCLAIIFLVGLGLRILVALFAPSHYIFSDSPDYVAVAENIVSGKGFYLGLDLLAVRPPFYPLFLASLKSMGLEILGMRIVQAILSSLCILLQYQLVFMCFKERSMALLGALLLALDPFHILFSALILTETLFIFILLIAMNFIHYIWQKSQQQHHYFFVLGVILGIGTLCRTATLTLIPWIVVFLFFACREKKWRVGWLILGAILAIAPWTLRNWLCFEKVVIVTTKAGVNLYEALGPGAHGGPRMLEMKVPEEAKQLDEVEKDIFLQNWMKRYLRENPWQIISLADNKLLRFWNFDLNHPKFKEHPIRWPLLLFTVLIYLCALWGLWKIPKDANLLFLLLPVVYFTLLHSIFLGSVRYRIPVMPYIQIIAAFGIWCGYTSYCQKSFLKKEKNGQK